MHNRKEEKQTKLSQESTKDLLMPVETEEIIPVLQKKNIGCLK